MLYLIVLKISFVDAANDSLSCKSFDVWNLMEQNFDIILYFVLFEQYFKLFDRVCSDSFTNSIKYFASNRPGR